MNTSIEIIGQLENTNDTIFFCRCSPGLAQLCNDAQPSSYEEYLEALPDGDLYSFHQAEKQRLDYAVPLFEETIFRELEIPRRDNTTIAAVADDETHMTITVGW